MACTIPTHERLVGTATPRVITDADVAGLFTTLDLPGAEYFRSVAESGTEADDAATNVEIIDEALALLGALPEPSERAKHDADCFLKHPACLAAKLSEILNRRA